MVTMELAKNLQQALESHRKQLKKHLKIWKKVQDQHAQDHQIVSAAKSFQGRTEQMIQQCSTVDFLEFADETGTSYSKKKRSRITEDLPRAKKARRESLSADEPLHDRSVSPEGRRIPVTTDPSGLFVIDSNPEKIDVLLNPPEDPQKKKKKNKRGHESDPEEEYVDAPVEVESSEGEEQSTSRRKKAKHSESVQQATNENEEYAEDIGKKVVLRLKEKDEIKKKNANKKRKRESDVSVAETDTQTDAGPSTKPPPSKKRKAKDAATKQPDPPKTESSVKRRKRGRADGNTTTDTAQPNAKKKKGKTSG